MCFSCSFVPTTNLLLQHLIEVAKKTPLEKLASALLEYSESNETALKILNAYDQFLAMLDHEDIRKELENLTADNAAASETFRQVRAFSNDFQEGLNQLFFKNHDLGPLTMRYGVF